MTGTTHYAFFGDMARPFKLTAEMIVELERKAGAGIGGLCKRMFNGEFGYLEITETIRLGLIGANTPPEEAEALVAAYARNRPLAETYPLAVAILEVLWFGKTQGASDGPA